MAGIDPYSASLLSPQPKANGKESEYKTSRADFLLDQERSVFVVLNSQGVLHNLLLVWI